MHPGEICATPLFLQRTFKRFQYPLVSQAVDFQEISAFTSTKFIFIFVHTADHCADARQSIKGQRAFSYNVLFNVIDGHKGHAFNDDDDESGNDEERWTCC